MKIDEYKLFACILVVYIDKAKKLTGEENCPVGILTPIDFKAFRHKTWKAFLSSFVFTDHISHIKLDMPNRPALSAWIMSYHTSKKITSSFQYYTTQVVQILSSFIAEFELHMSSHMRQWDM